jgi:GTP-binding protein
MQIISATFIKGVVGPDKILEGDTPQIALIGRSNVGKSSVINSLTNKTALARTSSFPGHTKQINVFSINDSFFLLDLPGYGFAMDSAEMREQLHDLIDWYLFRSKYGQKKVVLIIDANIGLTDKDLIMLEVLREHEKDVAIVANKVDKIKSSKYDEQFRKIRDSVGDIRIIPYSSTKKIGIRELNKEIFN